MILIVLTLDQSEQAEVFNVDFHDQFTKPSRYEIPVNFDSGETFHIDFSLSKVYAFLFAIGSKKIMGPDGIHGNYEEFVLAESNETTFIRNKCNIWNNCLKMNSLKQYNAEC